MKFVLNFLYSKTRGPSYFLGSIFQTSSIRNRSSKVVWKKYLPNFLYSKPKSRKDFPDPKDFEITFYKFLNTIPDARREAFQRKPLCIVAFGSGTNQKNSGLTSVDRSTRATLSTYNTWIQVSRLQKIYHFQRKKLWFATLLLTMVMA